MRPTKRREAADAVSGLSKRRNLKCARTRHVVDPGGKSRWCMAGRTALGGGHRWRRRTEEVEEGDTLNTVLDLFL